MKFITQSPARPLLQIKSKFLYSSTQPRSEQLMDLAPEFAGFYHGHITGLPLVMQGAVTRLAALPRL